MRSTGRCRRAARRQGPASQRGCPRSGRGRSGSGSGEGSGSSRGAAAAAASRAPERSGAGGARRVRREHGGRAAPGSPLGRETRAVALPWPAISGRGRFRDEGDPSLTRLRCQRPREMGAGKQTSWEQRLGWREVVLPCPSIFLFLFIRFFPLLCFFGGSSFFMPRDF